MIVQNEGEEGEWGVKDRLNRVKKIFGWGNSHSYDIS